MKINKLIAGLGALVIGMGAFVLPANADTTPVTNDSKATIEITGVTGATKVESYKIITANWDDTAHAPTTPQYVWANDSIAQWVQTNYSSYITGSNEVASTFVDTLGNDGQPATGTKTPIIDNGAAGFYAALLAAIKGGTVTGLTKLDADSINGDVATTSNATMGAWLSQVTSTQKTYRPVVTLVTPKGTGDSSTLSDKYTSEAKSSDLGLTKQTLSGYKGGATTEFKYKIDADVPVFGPKTTNHSWWIRDVVNTDKVDLDRTSVTVKAADGTDLSSVVTTDTVKTGNGGTTGIYVTVFDFTSVYDNVFATYAGQKVTIEYTLKVKDGQYLTADVSNTAINRTATDPYSSDTPEDTQSKDPGKQNPGGEPDPKNPGDGGGSSTDKVYKLTIKKQSNDGTALQGATFQITDGTDTLNFIKVNDNEYALANSSVTGVVTSVITPTDGTITLTGLAKSVNYNVKETEAPSGFIKLNDALVYTITDADNDGIIDSDSNGATASADTLTATIVNTRSFNLPTTGAAGITLLALVGGAMVVFGILLSKKKQEEE